MIIRFNNRIGTYCFHLQIFGLLLFWLPIDFLVYPFYFQEALKPDLQNYLFLKSKKRVNINKTFLLWYINILKIIITRNLFGKKFSTFFNQHKINKKKVDDLPSSHEALTSSNQRVLTSSKDCLQVTSKTTTIPCDPR